MYYDIYVYIIIYTSYDVCMPSWIVVSYINRQPWDDSESCQASLHVLHGGQSSRAGDEADFYMALSENVGLIFPIINSNFS